MRDVKHSLLLLALPLLACPAAGPGGDDDDSAPADDDDAVACEYPEGAVEPMALNEVIWPYAWADALDLVGGRLPIDLADAPCDTDPDIGWGDKEVVLFVSLPVW